MFTNNQLLVAIGPNQAQSIDAATVRTLLSLGGLATADNVPDDAIVNSKLANIASGTIKGRISVGNGDPEDLTGTQVTTLLDVFASGLKGLVPAPGVGDATKFLRGDGTWVTGAAGYTDEEAQDAVGTILTDSAEIDFTYNDATPSITASIVAASIANSKLAVMADQTIKGNVSGGSAVPSDLTATQVRTMINVANGATNVPRWRTWFAA